MVYTANWIWYLPPFTRTWKLCLVQANAMVFQTKGQTHAAAVAALFWNLGMDCYTTGTGKFEATLILEDDRMIISVNIHFIYLYTNQNNWGSTCGITNNHPFVVFCVSSQALHKRPFKPRSAPPKRWTWRAHRRWRCCRDPCLWRDRLQNHSQL